MTEFDYKEIVRKSADEDPKTKEIKEDHLKHIAEISKPPEESVYANLTRDEFEAELINKYRFKATKDTEDLYYYDESQGIFVKGGEWMIKRESLKYNPGITTSTVEQIKAHIIWGNYIDRSEFDSKIEWLCCKNVMVNLLTGETKSHSPDFMATVRIPHTYPLYSHVSAPTKIMQFFNQVMGQEDIETVLDFIAYCLWRGFPFHRWLLFNGSGRNGKGVSTNLIKHFLGRRNVSSESLHRILENKFAAANLFGKMANIDADLSSEALKRTGDLKKLTGGDEIPAEFKFKTAFGFENYAKLIFSANKVPITPDETDAFFARLLIINFPNQFLADKANPYLIDELTSEVQMSALLRVVIKRLPGVLESGISYAGNHTIGDNYLKYIQSSDPIRLFIETAIQVTTEGYETKDDVYASYSRFCDDKRLGKESSETFSRRLKKEGLHYKRKDVRGDKVYVWINIKLKDYAKVDEDQEILQ